MSDSSDTIRILRETLELERAATSRYAEHQSWAGDPRLCAYWEGLRRNEADHHSAILAELARTGVAKPDDPRPRCCRFPAKCRPTASGASSLGTFGAARIRDSTTRRFRAAPDS